MGDERPTGRMSTASDVGRKVQLDKRADAEWYLSLWVKHRDKCHKMYEKWQRMQDTIEEQIEKENNQKELVVG